MRLRLPEVLKPAPKVPPLLPPEAEFDCREDHQRYIRAELERQGRVDMWRGILVMAGIMVGVSLATWGLIWVVGHIHVLR